MPGVYVCADDTHGTAIMLKAEERGVTPEELIAEIKLEHEADFRAFSISHDNYHSTHSTENQAFSAEIYNKLVEAGQIRKKEVDQLFDPEKNMFLADRFIVGTCPRCKAEGQYGDNCEACGATYDATELINPVSKVSGATPVLKASTHIFFALSNFTGFLKEWTAAVRCTIPWRTNWRNGSMPVYRTGISAATHRILVLKSLGSLANTFMSG